MINSQSNFRTSAFVLCIKRQPLLIGEAQVIKLITVDTFVLKMDKVFRICGQILTTHGKWSSASRCVTLSGSHHVLEPEVKKNVQNIPGPTGIRNFPYIGMTFHFKPFTKHGKFHMSSVFLQLNERYGPIVKQRFGWDYWVLLFDPDDFGEVFKAEGPLPFREPLEVQKRYLTERNKALGLSCVNGEEWAELRKPVQKKILRPHMVARYAPRLSEVGDDLIARLQDQDHIDDLFNLMYYFAVESVGVLTFNKRLGCLSESEDYRWLRESFQTFSTLLGELLLWVPKKLKTPTYRQFENNADILYGMIEEEIAAAEQLIREQQKAGTFDPDNSPNLVYSLLTDDRMSGQTEKWKTVIMDLFTGGGESSASVLTSSLYHLARNPRKQERLYEEINRKLQESDSITDDTFKNMPYLKACIKESIRMTFPLPFGTSRRLENDANIRGYHIPKGTTVMLCANQVCMKPEIYPNPDVFLPERWLQGDSIRKKHPFALLPFGYGPRSCIGQRFAELELNVCVTKMIKNFQLMVDPGSSDVKHIHRIFAVPEKPLRIKLIKRNN